MAVSAARRAEDPASSPTDGARGPGAGSSRPIRYERLVDDHYLHRASFHDVTEALRASGAGERVGSFDAAVDLRLEPQILNQAGALQGGMAATLVDVASGLAVRQRVEAGTRFSTQDMTLHYLAGVRAGPARGLARVRRAGRRSVVVQAEILDAGAEDRLCLVATTSFALHPPPAPGEDARGPAPREEPSDDR